MAKKKLKHYKVGLDSEIYKISMVTEPAIEIDYVALAKQNEIKLSTDERHICYGPALVPNLDIYRNNGDMEYYLSFTDESIIKMSQEFMKEYRQHEINLQHEEDVDEVFVCESWLVEDPVFDKAKSLGFDVPKNTWMIGLKVNNIDTWERVKSGELRGFSVESLISLEDFSKIENNENIIVDMDEEMLFNKIKKAIKEIFAGKDKVEEELAANSGFTSVEDYQKEVEAIKEELEDETPAPTVEETPNGHVETPSEPSKVEEPITTPTEENKPSEEPKEEPTDNVKHLEDLLENVRSEVEALKEINKELTSKIKKMEKEPSAKPISVNAKPNTGDAYANWRNTMRQMIG